MHQEFLRVLYGQEMSALAEKMQIEHPDKIGSEQIMQEHHTSGSLTAVSSITW